jgi:site-specific DNA recombinase
MKAGEGRRRAALYARYSTDKQSEMSVEDQFRVSERIALREGFEVVARFEDRAITGGTSARPGYQAMLEGARRDQFDAIVAEDLKRLWREQAEQWRCIKELLDLDMCVVTASGIDSRQPNFESSRA